MSHPISLVVEAERIDGLEVPQGVVFQDLGMELGDPVNTVASNNGQVSHEDLVPLDWRRTMSQFCPVEGGLVNQVTAVDFIDNLHNPWQEAFNHIDWPTFHSFRQDSVVGIGS